MNNLALLKTFSTRLEAEIAKIFLKSRNIQTLIMADDAGGTYSFPFNPSNAGVRLMVKKKDLKKAIKELKDKNL